MKSKVFMIYFLILSYSAFGQQFLWSTVKNTTEKYIPLNNVTREVLTFYDQYKFYYDFSGFSKDGFIDYFDEESDNWDWLYEIKKSTVFALRTPTERGSIIFVMCINKDNVNAIIFSNNIEEGFIMTHSSDKEKFSRWFKTLLD